VLQNLTVNSHYRGIMQASFHASLFWVRHFTREDPKIKSAAIPAFHCGATYDSVAPPGLGAPFRLPRLTASLSLASAWATAVSRLRRWEDFEAGELRVLS
jgi:hypothetical protein